MVLRGNVDTHNEEMSALKEIVWQAYKTGENEVGCHPKPLITHANTVSDYVSVHTTQAMKFVVRSER